MLELGILCRGRDKTRRWVLLLHGKRHGRLRLDGSRRASLVVVVVIIIIVRVANDNEIRVVFVLHVEERRRTRTGHRPRGHHGVLGDGCQNRLRIIAMDAVHLRMLVLVLVLLLLVLLLLVLHQDETR